MRPTTKISHQWLLSVRPAFLASLLKRVLRIKRVMADSKVGRFWVDPLSNFGATILTSGSYEPGMMRVLEELLSDGDVFLDIGANEGYFSIQASRRVGPEGRVFAVEPQTRLQNVLMRNLAENDAGNVLVIQRAISENAGMAELFLAPDVNTGASGLGRATKYAVATEQIPKTTLLKLLTQLGRPRIRLMKMDIEGFEWEAILGSREIFKTGEIENFALELHPTQLASRGKTASEILKFLEECGYRQLEKFPTLVFTCRRN